jgi:hypothetical protein
MTAYGHLAATDVRDGVSVVGESGRRIPVGHSSLAADRALCGANAVRV